MSTQPALSRVVAVTVLGGLLVFATPQGGSGPNAAPNAAQETGPSSPPIVVPPPESTEALPTRPVGSSSNYCEAPSLTVSRSLAFQSEDVAWRVVGLLPGSQVAPRLTDPLAPSSARSIPLASVLTNSLCEAIGSFSAADLPPTTYAVSVLATTNAGGRIELVDSLTIVASPRPTPTPRPPPGAPGGVRATTVNATTIRLDWADNSNNETGFRIDSDAGQFRTGANVVTYNVGGLQSNWVYCFAVYSFNDTGESYGGTSCAWTAPRSP